ncbi:MAG: response regulator [Desulfococcaceae bacterium]|jgi:two-component system phosphate regulon response regulator PhoB|nr:response regulator [Desulfococcaceae bacterium]
MNKETILIVDDEEDILELLRYNLAAEGYDIICAESGEAALELAESRKPDLIVLDLMLPGIDGLDVTRLLRKNEKTLHIPIIMLTAKGTESDVVTGLELGADDYVTKPFSPRILNARVRAVLRRAETAEETDGEKIQIGELCIDPGRRRVEIEGKNADLSYTEFQILLFLARRPGWVFTRSQIVDAVRGTDYPVTDRSVDVQIVGLRKKMKHCGAYIETVRGVGYRFREDA